MLPVCINLLNLVIQGGGVLLPSYCLYEFSNNLEDLIQNCSGQFQCRHLLDVGGTVKNGPDCLIA